MQILDVRLNCRGVCMFIKLRDVRIEKGISIRELEQKSGVDRSTISRIENEQAIPSVLTLCKLAYALNVTLDDLVEYTEYCEKEKGE